MAAGGTAGMWSVLVLLFLGVCKGTSGFLNLEELSHMKYGIEIAAEPVLRGQSKADDIVMVTSKYKQKYECQLPALAVKFHHDREDDSPGYSGQAISDLLKPMEAAPCLVKTKDWWTYELCYGKHVQQYHLEELNVKGDVLYLGYYQSEFDWNNETAKASKHHRLKRYHSQLYVNGSKCDLNGQTRETEVRFVCEEGSGDYIARIDEPQSCMYVLTVHTTRICHHPFLRPPSSGTPQSIYCHPVLSPEQYVEYVKAQVTDTKRIVEEISEELKVLEPKVQHTKETSPAVDEQELSLHDDTEQAAIENEGEEEEMTDGNFKGDDDMEDSGSDFWNKVQRPESSLSREGEEDVPNVHVPDDPTEGLENQVLHKVIQNPAELLKFIDELKQSVKKVKEKKLIQEPVESTETTVSEEAPSLETAAGEDSIEKTGEEYDAEKTDREEDEENKILREFEKELDDMLLPKSEMPDLKQEVKSGMENEFDNIIDETQEEMVAEGLKGEFDRKQASQYLASTLNKLLDKLNGNDPELRAVDGEDDTAGTNPSPAAKNKDDSRVKVRVTKVKPGSPLQKEMKVREMSHENPQLRHIENVVKDLLEKGGLKAEGKIEIKILTTGAFSDDDETHWLSEEDTKNLKDIFFNIFIHGTEEVHKEERRQQQLEDNYRFVWDQNTDEAKTSGNNAESDELDF